MLINRIRRELRWVTAALMENDGRKKNVRTATVKSGSGALTRQATIKMSADRTTLRDIAPLPWKVDLGQFHVRIIDADSRLVASISPHVLDKVLIATAIVEAVNGNERG